MLALATASKWEQEPGVEDGDGKQADTGRIKEMTSEKELAAIYPWCFPIYNSGFIPAPSHFTHTGINTSACKVGSDLFPLVFLEGKVGTGLCPLMFLEAWVPRIMPFA